MSRFALAMLLLISLAESRSVLAGDATISQLLSNPLTFDGRHVSVSGTAESVTPESSRWGQEYETFQLCEQSCISVFTEGHPQITEGKRVTVNGSFVADTSFGPFVLHDEIIRDNGSQ